jgi:FkbH-like protein
VQVRVALTGGATTSMLEEPLQLVLETLGVGCTLHASPYNTLVRQMLDPASETVAFKPDITVIVTTPSNIATWPDFDASEADVQRATGDVSRHWVDLCRSLHEQTPCEIILDNFHALPLHPLGAAGARTAGDHNRFIDGVNRALADQLPPYVHVHDVASLAAMYGVYHWFDPRHWHHGKHPVSFECLVPYVRTLAQIIAALRGRSAKCLVLDLDNTLWGGIVGDDGPERLTIGPGDPVGEAFQAFQRYALELKQRGVLLAVCSKNDEDVALAPFSSRPEMVLRREDFSAFVANWEPKSRGLRRIAEQLRLGLDALVMVDDNPAERAQIRHALPEVKVLEVGADPSDYPLALEQSGWFETVVVSSEDRRRGEMYRENTAREESRATTGDYATYLESLHQRARTPFESTTLDRVAQLTGKTNQFNLTTLRLGRAELEEMIDSPNHLTATVHLADRFGDNGLISVFAGRGLADELWVDLWLISCRVLSRGVEQALLNYVVERATESGYRLLHGIYRPTPRNQLVRGLYQSLGFTAAEPVTGGEHWAMDVRGYTPFMTTIAVEDVPTPVSHGSPDD